MTPTFRLGRRGERGPTAEHPVDEGQPALEQGRGARASIDARDNAAIAEKPTPALEPPPEAVAASAINGAERDDWQWGGLIITAPAITLGVLVCGMFLMFLLIEPSPRWLVLFGTAVSALALDGVLRAGRREAFLAGGLDSTPLLLVPTLFVLATPVFLEHNVRGYWAVPAGLLGGAGYGLLVVTTVSSVREHDAARALGRFVTAAATYVIAFALFSLVYTFDIPQRPAAIAVGLVGMLLAVELLREGEIDPVETMLYAVVTGAVVAELRWTLHYLPLDGYLAGLTLLLTFYFVTGLLHAHVTRQLDRTVTAEYVAIVAAGVVFIIGARATGIA